MRIFVALFAGLIAAAPAVAQYICNENGITVYTDRPCLSSASNSGTAAITDHSGYSTISGSWRGQVQFMAKSGTAVVTEAHAIVPFVIEIDPQGKVTGSSNGCSLKGIAMPSSMDVITSLDVTLTGCSHPAYNRQMTGRLALYKAQKYVDFSITSYDMLRRPVGYYEIKGTLRR